jgi:hypothetical protein
MAGTAGLVICVAVGALVAAAVLLAWWLSRPRPAQYGKPAHTTDAMWWLVQEMLALAPGSQCGGTFAAKPGYHNYRDALPSWDYSVTDPPDRGGPGDVCAAFDWTFPEAQRGDYSRISVFTRRLIDSGRDPGDPRLDGWRECYGNADWDDYVEGYDFRYDCDATSDKSHLWHIHGSEDRDQASSMENKKRFLSVLKGETVAQWRAKGGGGTVFVQHPKDAARQDLFWVGPGGSVMHQWGKGLDAFWSGSAPAEDLGGHIAAGTLTAMWQGDQSGLYIAGVGTQDGNGPDGAGQFWGMRLDDGGARSGWGSFEKDYARYPGGSAPVVVDHAPGDQADRAVMAVLAVVLVLCALALLTDLLTG